MQQQPHLVDLGMARLEIFKTFCLPTMLGQSSNAFLWVIRTDPDLDASVRRGMMEALDNQANILLVGSNLNPEGWLREDLLDIDRSDVWSGSFDLLQHYHEAVKTRVYFESRLDADDGLHTRFVHYVREKSHVQDSKSWLVWCIKTHMEWQYQSPFEEGDPDDPHGYLVGVKYNGCVTPGLTMAYGTEVTRASLPPGRHTTLHETLPKCPSGPSHNNNNNNTDNNKGTHHERQPMTNCLLRFDGLSPGAIRARTPTSAGMSNVVLDDKGIYSGAAAQARRQKELWEGVEHVFALDRTNAVTVRAHVQANLAAIARDNLLGQCTKGHSCKEAARRLLEKLSFGLNQ